MLINKITTGFVIQTFDTDKGEYISQEFVAGEVEYEKKATGEPCGNIADEMNLEIEPYLPFEMIQP